MLHFDLFSLRTKLKVCLIVHLIMETIVVAGGTGLIGKKLIAYWKNQGHVVRCLTRNESDVRNDLFHWDPSQNEIDTAVFKDMTILVNLSGAGIADKKWSKERMAELYSSRIQPADFLYSLTHNHPTLKQYISASGAVCYGFEDDLKIYKETDPFGKDTLSDITQKWEQSALQFQSFVKVTCIRISVVLAKEGGALLPISKPVKYGFGAILGNGQQGMPWIHINDLIRVFDHAMTHQLEGAFNANAGNTTNAILTKTIASVLKKPLWLPRVPAFALKMVLGPMSSVVLLGLKADASKLIATDFKFEYTDLEKTLKDLLL